MKGTLENPVKVMRNAIKHASKDPYRPIIQAVHLDECGDVVATDSYRLYREKSAWNGPNIDMDYATAYDISKCKVKGNDKAEIEYVGGKLVVKMGDGTEIIGAITEGKYPNYKNLFETTPTTIAYINTKQLMPILKEHVKLKDDVVIEIAERDFHLRGACGEPTATFEKACDGEDIKIGVDPKYLGDALSVVGECEMKFADSKKPIVIESGNTSILVMPVRLLEPKGMKQAPKSPEPKIEADELNLVGEHVCITGVLTGMTRSEAFFRLKQIGGIPSEKFTSKTTVMVVGANRGKDKCDKAEKAIEKGQKVKVVAGMTFVDALKKAEKDKEESMKKKQEIEKPLTKQYKGKRFYISDKEGTVQTFTTKSGAKFELVIGHEYAYRNEGKMVMCMFMGIDTVKNKPCFAEVTDDGDFWYFWPGDKKTLEYMVKHCFGEPSYTIDKPKLTKPNVEKPKSEKPKAPKPPKKPEEKQEETPIVVSLDFMKEWCKDKNLVASQKREGCCIWVEGDSKGYKEELVELGFRFAGKRKSWYFDPKRA